MRRAATIIVALQAFLFVFYLLTGLIGSQVEFGIVFTYRILPLLVLVILVFIARKWPLIGGTLLTAAGVACLSVVFSTYTADPGGLGSIFAVLVFIFGVLPPLMAGILFILSWRIDRRLGLG